MTSAGVCYDEETVQAEMLRKQELLVHSNIWQTDKKKMLIDLILSFLYIKEAFLCTWWRPSTLLYLPSPRHEPPLNTLFTWCLGHRFKRWILSPYLEKQAWLWKVNLSAMFKAWTRPLHLSDTFASHSPSVHHLPETSYFGCQPSLKAHLISAHH